MFTCVYFLIPFFGLYHNFVLALGFVLFCCLPFAYSVLLVFYILLTFVFYLHLGPLLCNCDTNSYT